MNEDLKLCPFCGANADVIIHGNEIYSSKPRDSYSVSCNGCDIETPIFYTEEEAIEAWNRRA